MKKILTLALVGAMLTATGITAFAETTDVIYEVAPVYTVVIPETVTLTDSGTTETISIYGATANDNVVIGKTQKVNVALTASANNFNVKTADGDTVAYTVNDKNAVADLTTVAECTAADGKKDTNITFAKTGTAAYAGTYTDTLTFGIAVEDAATVPVTVNTSLGIGTSSSKTIQFKKITVYYTENGSTEEKSESFTTTDAISFTGEKFKITAASDYVDEDGVSIEQDKPINIESLNGENITKVDLTVGYFGGRSSYIRTTPSTTISGNDSVGGTITLKL